MKAGSTNDLDVFINCPFDEAYQPFFDAIVWTVMRYGYRARCAKEADDSGRNRLQKIIGIIGECRFAVHDISRTEPDAVNALPRFNMPLELGLWLGAEAFGGEAHAERQCCVFDVDQYRFQKFISDIAGHDIHAHGGRVDRLIVELTKWLRTLPGEDHPGGGEAMIEEYELFRGVLPVICRQKRLTLEELTFGDFTGIVERFVTARSEEVDAGFPEASAASVAS
jgi:hypothetical protein